MAKNQKSAEKSKTVGTVLERLKAKARPARGKKTLVLSLNSYEEFDEICRQQDHFPSDVVDEFINLFVEEHKRDRGAT